MRILELSTRFHTSALKLSIELPSSAIREGNGQPIMKSNKADRVTEAICAEVGRSEKKVGKEVT